MCICFTTCLVPSKALADRFHFSAGGFTLVGYASCLKGSTNIGDFGGFIYKFDLWPFVRRNTRGVHYRVIPRKLCFAVTQLAQWPAPVCFPLGKVCDNKS